MRPLAPLLYACPDALCSHNPDIFADLFPDRSRAEHDAMTEEKEARFRAMAGSALQPLPGLRAFCDALKRRGVRRAAVTNAPRANVRITWRVACCILLTHGMAWRCAG